MRSSNSRVRPGWYVKRFRDAGRICTFAFAVVALFCSTVLIGCDESLVVRREVVVPFSIYGVLSPDLEVQSIRVYPLEALPTLRSPEPLDADVFSTDLETGARVAWRDSVLVEPNGQYDHVFWASHQVEYGHRYRIEVIRRSDGARTYAEVRVPDPVDVRILDDQNAVVMPVLIHGNGIRVLKPEVVYDIDIGDCDVVSNRFSYVEERVNGGWQIELHLFTDHDRILWTCGDGQTQFASGRCPNLRLRSVQLHLLVGDSVWSPPGGVLNPDVLSQPGVMSNVVNGFGFIGAGYRDVARLHPSTEALNRACFIDVSQ